MMKLSRLLSGRKQVFEKSVKLKDAADICDSFSFQSFSSRPDLSTPSHKYTPQALGDQTARIFAPYSVYKGKAALSLDPLLPTFTKLESGNQVVDRRGAMILRFLPAIGERKYDWEKRQVFALSPTEIGTLLNLGPKDSCEFFHDPSILSSKAGQVKKSLSIKSIGEGTGYFVSLSVVNNLLKTKESFTVPVTAGEFAVMKTACSFALPHIIGWDRLTKHPGSSESLSSSKKDTKLIGGLEWDK